jgi:hypothetical protein
MYKNVLKDGDVGNGRGWRTLIRYYKPLKKEICRQLQHLRLPTLQPSTAWKSDSASRDVGGRSAEKTSFSLSISEQEDKAHAVMDASYLTLRYRLIIVRQHIKRYSSTAAKSSLLQDSSPAIRLPLEYLVCELTPAQTYPQDATDIAGPALDIVLQVSPRAL